MALPNCDNISIKLNERVSCASKADNAIEPGSRSHLAVFVVLCRSISRCSDLNQRQKATRASSETVRWLYEWNYSEHLKSCGAVLGVYQAISTTNRVDSRFECCNLNASNSGSRSKFWNSCHSEVCSSLPTSDQVKLYCSAVSPTPDSRDIIMEAALETCHTVLSLENECQALSVLSVFFPPIVSSLIYIRSHSYDSFTSFGLARKLKYDRSFLFSRRWLLLYHSIISRKILSQSVFERRQSAFELFSWRMTLSRFRVSWKRLIDAEQL